MAAQLQDKVVLVTGGARGIGKTISMRFAAEGAAVVMAGRNADAGVRAETEIREQGGRAAFVETDVGDPTQVADAVEFAVSTFGSLTTLVNNAGGGGGRMQGPVADLDPAVWDDVMRVDVSGAFHACRAAIPHLVEAGGGSIMAMGSTVATYGQRRIPAGVTAKQALTGLMRAIAVDYGPDRIRANTIVLGLVPHDEYLMVTEGEIGQAMLSAHCLPMFGEPSDAASAALFLASDESRWITGTELVVSGGIARAPDILELLSRQLAASTDG